MVQIIPANPSQKRSFGEQVLAGLSEAAPGIQQHFQKQQQLQQMQQENQAAKRMGVDLSGISDPKTRQEIVSLALQGQNQLALEEKKQGAPQKPLTQLQESQKKLADERFKALQSNQNLFQSLSGQQSPDMQQQDQENPQMQGQDQSQDQQGRFDISTVPEDKLRQIAAFKGQPGQEGTLGNIAQFELDKRETKKKEDLRKFEGERAFHTGYSKEAVKKADAIRESLPRKEMALNFARNAVESGNVEYFSPDKLADATGNDLFRTAKGAQLITAGKENLLSNMARVSSKAQNQWFEQKLNSMFPRIGQSNEANLTTQEMLEAEAAMDKAYLEEFDRIQEEDDKNYGFERKDIEKRARQAVKPLENHIMNRASFRMKEIEETEKGLTSMKKDVGKNVSKGTPLTMAMAKLYVDKFGKENALKVAEKNGYTIPSPDEFSSYQKIPQEFREEL